MPKDRFRQRLGDAVEVHLSRVFSWATRTDPYLLSRELLYNSAKIGFTQGLGRELACATQQGSLCDQYVLGSLVASASPRSTTTTACIHIRNPPVTLLTPGPPRTYSLGTGAFKGPLRTYYLGTWGWGTYFLSPSALPRTCNSQF